MLIVEIAAGILLAAFVYRYWRTILRATTLIVVLVVVVAVIWYVAAHFKDIAASAFFIGATIVLFWGTAFLVAWAGKWSREQQPPRSADETVVQSVMQRNRFTRERATEELDKTGF